LKLRLRNSIIAGRNVIVCTGFAVPQRRKQSKLLCVLSAFKASLQRTQRVSVFSVFSFSSPQRARRSRNLGGATTSPELVLQSNARPSSASTPCIHVILVLLWRRVIQEAIVTTENPGPETKTAGLCAHCKHVRTIRSDRGSVFYLCRRSSTGPTYPQYPRLPVLFCRGYEAQSPKAGLQGNE